ncbi:EAL domain/GGDEF domain protein, partial [Pseudomonas syringae pv. actinidiae ICMP 19096]
CAHVDASQLADLASQAKHFAKDVAGASIHVIDSTRMDLLMQA